MIVPSMTYDELRKEVLGDVEFAKRKSLYIEVELEKKMKRDKLKTYTHIYDYVSPKKNKWIVKMEIGKKEVARTFVTYFYVDNKIAAVQILDTPFILYYTTHFFTRYKERLKLDIIKPEDIIRKYLRDSNNFVPKVLETDDTLSKMFIVCEQGIILGTLHQKSCICKMNTFLSPDMLKPDQFEIEKIMKERLTRYNKDSGIFD